MRIAVLSNINLFKLIHRIRKWAQVYEAEGYGSWVQPLLDGGMGGDYVLCLLDGRQFFAGLGKAGLRQARDRVQEHMSYIEEAARSHPERKYLVSDMDVLPEGLLTLREVGSPKLLEYIWASELSHLSQECPNLYVFPLKDIISGMGREEAYSNKMWYLSSSRLSRRAEAEIEATLLRMLGALEGKRRKCLLLDLDNTLWGGVLGEEGIEGVQLSESGEGARYKDFQKRIRDLKEMGVILAMVSKNNEADAKEMFETHPDMALRWGDFAARKVNWQPKSQNIEELQGELNIGLDSMVLIDDSPMEREEVRLGLPEVAVPGFPEDSSDLADFMGAVYQEYFLTAEATQEDRDKTELYQQRGRREEERKRHGSLDSYLRSLRTEVAVERLMEADIGRAVQLLQKTNQFNLTTKRYTEAQLRGMMGQDRYDIWIAQVVDRFGDNGKTALLIIEKEQRTVTIDSFIMSCRIMGRRVEDSILHGMERHYMGLGYERLQAKYIPSRKNKPVECLYERVGYTLSYCSSLEKGYESSLASREDMGFSKVQWRDSRVAPALGSGGDGSGGR